MVDKLRESYKALVAVLAPALVVVLNEVSVEASKQASTLVAALFAGLVVWITPNRPKA